MPDKFQVGKKFVGARAATARAVIKMVSVVDGKTFITFEFASTSKYGKESRGVATYEKTDFLYYYKEAEDFFVAGGEYKSGTHTYYVQEIFTISSPVTASYRKQARAVVIDSRGRRWMDMLNIGDFKYAKRVK